MSTGTFTDRHGQKYTIGAVKGIVGWVAPNLWMHSEYEDIVQEVAIRLHNNNGYPATIVARSAVIDYLRKHGKRGKYGNHRSTRDTLSLDVPVEGSDSAYVVDTIEDTGPSVEDTVCQETLDDLLAPLSERERYIVIAAAVGVGGIAIGEACGITESRVSQVRAGALAKIVHRHSIPVHEHVPVKPEKPAPIEESYVVRRIREGATAREVAVELGMVAA